MMNGHDTKSPDVSNMGRLAGTDNSLYANIKSTTYDKSICC